MSVTMTRRRLPRKRSLEKLPAQKEVFAEYLRYYIKKITGKRQEFFLSVCDIEEEPLKALCAESFQEYRAVVIDSGDYSEAVRARNEAKSSKIVLFSSEGVKQIDSLKDFNEYSVRCPDREMCWECIAHAFSISSKNNKVKEFLDIVLEESEVGFWDFFTYVYQSMSEGILSPQKLNENLPCLGVWKSSRQNVLGKGAIRRMIKLSKDVTMERRLTRALTEDLILGETEQGESYEKIVSASLAKGDLKTILKKIPFEDAEKWLKGTPRGESGYILFSAENNETEETSCFYSCSYEYCIREHDGRRPEEVEAEWLRGKDRDDLDVVLNWKDYPSLESEAYIRGELEQLWNKAGSLNLPEDRRSALQEKIHSLYTLFTDAYSKMIKATPICLKEFCGAAAQYTQTYFELLAYMLTDEIVRRELVGTGIVSALENLGCEKDGTKILMPFWHPVRVMYYMELQRMYEYILGRQTEEEIRELAEETCLQLVDKLKMRFPVEFINWEGNLYALDFTTLRDKGVVEFADVRGEVAYSALEFGLVDWEITDYLSRRKICTEVTIAMVEIRDLKGLPQLVEKIKKRKELLGIHISRVDFLILSSKEEKLKKQLAGMWDLVGTEELVRFRFGRNNYYTEEGYDIEAVVQAADLTIFADCSTLYHAPRMIRHTKEAGLLGNRLARMDIQEQVGRYFEFGTSDMVVLWDSLQHAERQRSEGFWLRSSREINGNVLERVNGFVSKDYQRAIVLLSSNDDILNEVHERCYLQVGRYQNKGEHIIALNYDKRWEAGRISIESENPLRCSLMECYSGILGMSNICRLLPPGQTDMFLTICLDGDEVCCQCSGCWGDSDEKDKSWERVCEKWLNWQTDMLSGRKNILEKYFSDLMLGQWYEEARSVSEVLLVRKFGKRAHFTVNMKTEEEMEQEARDWLERIFMEQDRLEVMQIQDLLDELETFSVIDNRLVQTFKEKNAEEILERIVDADAAGRFLERGLRRKVDQMLGRMKEGRL